MTRKITVSTGTPRLGCRSPQLTGSRCILTNAGTQELAQQALGGIHEVSFSSPRIILAALSVAASSASDREAKPSAPRPKQHKRSHKLKSAASVTPVHAGVQRPSSAVAQPIARAAAFAGEHPDGTINSSWNGGTGNWNVNGDWTPGTGFPNNGAGNTYNVTIGTGNDNVSLNTSVTISSLTLGASSGSSILQNLSGSTETLNDLALSAAST